MLAKLLTAKNILICAFVLALLLPNGVFAAATMALSPASLSYQINTNFEVTVRLDTGGANTTGADLYFTFDSEYLNLVSINDGNIYSTYLGKTVDNSGGNGSVSGLISPGGEAFNGSGTFATLQFKALKVGSTNLTIDFTPNDPNDSNVAEAGKTADILGSVTNASYTIATTVAPTSSAANPTSTTTANATITTALGSNGTGSLPNSGSTLTTTIIGIFSVLLIGVGALLVKKV